MWRIDSPIDTAEGAAAACVRGLRDAIVKNAVSAALPQIAANGREYRNHACASTLHSTDSTSFPVPGVSDTEMRKLYTDGMVRRSTGRQTYDRIMSSAPHGRCGYCQYSQAKTLDHFAPKELLPTLAVDPWNLIPSCHQCNHELLAAWSGRPEEEFLHPYFMPDIGRWLRVTVNHTRPVTVNYHADPNPALPQMLRDRVKYQFDTLGLGDLYSIIATQELTGLSRRLPQIGAAETVRAHLQEVAELDLAADQNNRRGALMEALSGDEWYCAGGYA